MILYSLLSLCIRPILWRQIHRKRIGPPSRHALIPLYCCYTACYTAAILLPFQVAICVRSVLSLPSPHQYDLVFSAFSRSASGQDCGGRFTKKKEEGHQAGMFFSPILLLYCYTASLSSCDTCMQCVCVRVLCVCVTKGKKKGKDHACSTRVHEMWWAGGRALTNVILSYLESDDQEDLIVVKMVTQLVYAFEHQNETPPETAPAADNGKAKKRVTKQAMLLFPYTAATAAAIAAATAAAQSVPTTTRPRPRQRPRQRYWNLSRTLFTAVPTAATAMPFLLLISCSCS